MHPQERSLASEKADKTTDKLIALSEKECIESREWTEKRLKEVHSLVEALDDLQVSSERIAAVHEVGNTLVLMWGYADKGQADMMTHALYQLSERTEKAKQVLCGSN